MSEKEILERSALLPFAAFVRDMISGHEGRSRIELVTFSGLPADVMHRDDGAVYLRCRATRIHDGQGKSAEIVGRLAALGGAWVLPAEECELVALVAEDAGQVPGAAYLLPLHGAPPVKADQGKAYATFGDTVKWVAKAASFAWKVAANTTLAVDEDGAFSVVIGGRSYLKFGPGGPSSLPALELAIVDNDGKVRSVFKVTADGIELLAANAAGTTKQIWKIGADGAFTAFGTGNATLGWRAGSLGAGATGVTGVQYGPPPGAPSVSWNVSP